MTSERFDRLSDKQREYLEKILRGIGQMGELIDDLLDVSRITRGRLELRRAPVERHAAVRRRSWSAQDSARRASTRATFS